jgi:hypothetical protein
MCNAGVIIGIVLRFGLSSSFLCTDSSVEFIFSQRLNVEECAEGDVLEIRENIQISSYNAKTGNGDSFFCTVQGKAFQDQEGNYIRETVSFLINGGVTSLRSWDRFSLQALLHDVYPRLP